MEGLACAGGQGGCEERMGLCGEAELFEVVYDIVRYSVPGPTGEELKGSGLLGERVVGWLDIGGFPGDGREGLLVV